MKTPNEIKDEVAKSHGYNNWETLLEHWHTSDWIDFSNMLYEWENEAMELYAGQFNEAGRGDGSLSDKVCEFGITEHNKSIFYLGQCQKCYSNKIY